LSDQENAQQNTATDSAFAPQQVSTAEEKRGQPSQNSMRINWDKKIIKTANLNAQVKNYNAFSKQVSENVKKYGGYISAEEQVQTEYKIENSVVIKVPVDLFESAVNNLVKDAEIINEKRIISEDVTTQLIDGKSRLEAKRQVRLRYLDLLKQARNMEEVLTVQKEINGIHEEIETVTGRINFLQHSSAMSTINLTFYQVLNASANVPNHIGFLPKIKSAFTEGLYWTGEILVGIVCLWPLILILAFSIYLLRKTRVVKI
ncbi:MAG TPA: DUF4349 domain-containing protein, partial [Flavitalea sp.]|nr:DUF4349 domain-containing protein [Flavitalea sp.]